MTMRYAAVMPPLFQQEFEMAFALKDEEHRAGRRIGLALPGRGSVSRLDDNDRFRGSQRCVLEREQERREEDE